MNPPKRRFLHCAREPHLGSTFTVSRAGPRPGEAEDDVGEALNRGEDEVAADEDGVVEAVLVLTLSSSLAVPEESAVLVESEAAVEAVEREERDVPREPVVAELRLPRGRPRFGGQGLAQSHVSEVRIGGTYRRWLPKIYDFRGQNEVSLFLKKNTNVCPKKFI